MKDRQNTLRLIKNYKLNDVVIKDLLKSHKMFKP